jgi:hypothetical protein
MEKAYQMRQVWIKKANISEPSFKRRKHQDDIETRSVILTWDEAYREPAYWISDVRRRDGAILIRALMRNCRNLGHRCQGRKPSAKTQGSEYQCDVSGTDRLV